LEELYRPCSAALCPLDHGHPSSGIGWLFGVRWLSNCSEGTVAIDWSHPMFSDARCHCELLQEI